MVRRKGNAVLAVFVDIDPEMDADFNAWYNQEHVGDLLGMPGFLNAARYEILKGGPRYLACYELESIDALKTPEYLDFRRNPSEWTKKISLSVNGRNYVRNVYTQIYPQENDEHMLGRGMAPALQIGRMEVPADVEAKYNEYYDTVRTPGNLTVPGCIAVRRYHAVEGSLSTRLSMSLSMRKCRKPPRGMSVTPRIQCTSSLAAPTAMLRGLPGCTAAYYRQEHSRNAKLGTLKYEFPKKLQVKSPRHCRGLFRGHSGFKTIFSFVDRGVSPGRQNCPDPPWVVR